MNHLLNTCVDSSSRSNFPQQPFQLATLLYIPEEKIKKTTQNKRERRLCWMGRKRSKVFNAVISLSLLGQERERNGRISK